MLLDTSLFRITHSPWWKDIWTVTWLVVLIMKVPCQPVVLKPQKDWALQRLRIGMGEHRLGSKMPIIILG